MTDKYVIYYSDLTFLNWDGSILIFDTRESAERFVNALSAFPFFDYTCGDEEVYITTVNSSVEETVYTFNATNLIPVQNGDDVALIEVKE